MEDSQPFCSLSIGRPIPEIKLFQTLTLKLQGRSRSWVWSKGKVIQSAQYYINSLPFNFTPIRPTIPKIELFDLETSKVKVMSEVKAKGHILYPVSNQCTSFLFHINRTNHSWDMAKIVFDLEKTYPKFLKKFANITVFNRISEHLIR